MAESTLNACISDAMTHTWIETSVEFHVDASVSKKVDIGKKKFVLYPQAHLECITFLLKSIDCYQSHVTARCLLLL